MQDDISVGEALGDAGEPVLGAVPDVRTSRKQVLVTSANVQQFGQRQDAGRRKNFAKRINALADKALGEDEDGMGSMPDIILLQESSYENAKDISAKLKDKTGITFPIANKKGDYSPNDEGDINREAETVILFNKRTMEKLTALGGFKYDAEYSKEQKSDCAEEPELQGIDADLDGVADCFENREFKRQFMYAFAELKADPQAECPNPPCGTGFRVAVASTHLTTGEHLAKEYRKSLKKEWSEDVADKLRRKYPATVGVDAYVIAGDFNIHRCENKPEGEPRDYPTGTLETCARSSDSWWDALTTGKGYSETVYEKHQNDSGGESDRLHMQYRDGCLAQVNAQGECAETDYRFGKKRIDFIFARRAPVVASSRDLTCGQTGGTNRIPAHCDSSSNPQRYSDHRLVWTLIGG